MVRRPPTEWGGVLSPKLWSLNPAGNPRVHPLASCLSLSLTSCRAEIPVERNPGLWEEELTPTPNTLHFPKPRKFWRNVASPAPGSHPVNAITPPPTEPRPPKPTDRSSPGPRHCGPEEAPPVGVLEDVGQHAGEKPAAVQHNLLLLL